MKLADDRGLQIASLALDGGRYEEAANLFSIKTAFEDAPAAWAGLGAARLGQFVQDRTAIEEVRSCFEAARSRCEGDRGKRQVELYVARRSALALRTLYGMARSLSDEQDAVDERVTLAAAGAGLSVLFGTRSSSAFGTLASYNVFDRSADALEDSCEDRREIALNLKNIERKIEEVVSLLRNFSKNPDEAYSAVLEEVSEAEAHRTGQRHPTVDSVGAKKTGGEVPAGPWHVHHDGVTRQVESWHLLAEEIKGGRIQPAAYVWHPSLEGWTPAGKVVGAGPQLLNDSSNRGSGSSAATPADTASAMLAFIVWATLVVGGIIMFFVLLFTAPFTFIPALFLAIWILNRGKKKS